MSGLGLLIIALTSLAAPAAAQPRPGASANAEGDAAAKVRDFIQRGKGLYASGKKQDAYEMFKAAWDLRRSFDVAGNLGIVALELGKMREAAEYLSFWKANAPVAESPQRVAMIEARLAEARKHVGAVRVEVRRGGAAGSAAESAEGAKVLVDGEAVGRAPVQGEVFLDPGKHVVSASLPGYGNAEKAIEVRKGSTEAVTLVLEPARVEAGETEGKDRVLIGVGLGLVAAGLGAGIGFTLAANSAGSELRNTEKNAPFNGDRSACYENTSNRRCAELKDTAGSLDTFSNIAVVGFAVGGAAALGVATYLLLPPSRGPSKTGVQSFPWVASGSAGLVVSGSM